MVGTAAGIAVSSAMQMVLHAMEDEATERGQQRASIHLTLQAFQPTGAAMACVEAIRFLGFSRICEGLIVCCRAAVEARQRQLDVLYNAMHALDEQWYEGRRRWGLPRHSTTWRLMENVDEWEDEHFRASFRISRETFDHLAREMLPYLAWQHTVMHWAISVHRRVAIYNQASNSTYLTLSNLFAVSRSTICEIVMDLIVEMFMDDVIHLGDTREVMAGFKEKGFPDLLGCIDGLTLKFWGPASWQEQYYGHKHDIASCGGLNWMLHYYNWVLYRSHDTDIYAGVLHRSHDTAIFWTSPLTSMLINGWMTQLWRWGFDGEVLVFRARDTDCRTGWPPPSMHPRMPLRGTSTHSTAVSGWWWRGHLGG
ncbi:uncharacterized protein LOC128338657 [Hemicordylus capensis]|uniref:uncharacterized protein LOC128338657 n=1 Tax=Hemicordylus capensis TaxID=884348 RepID=UPI0023043A95|nr:uncharacterized protein LOC128338657 [Hemicordylus capensis]